MAAENKLCVTCLRWILFILLHMSVSILLVCNRHYQNFSTKMSHCVLFWRLWVDFFFMLFGNMQVHSSMEINVKVWKINEIFHVMKKQKWKKICFGFCLRKQSKFRLWYTGTCVNMGLASNPGSTSSVLSRALMLYHCPGWDLYFHQLHHSSSSVGGTLTCVNLFANAMMCVAAVKSCGSVQCL